MRELSIEEQATNYGYVYEQHTGPRGRRDLRTLAVQAARRI